MRCEAIIGGGHGHVQKCGEPASLRWSLTEPRRAVFLCPAHDSVLLASE